jgi:hypothetical protein
MQYYTPLQKQFNSPNSQNILHQNSQDSKVYLSRSSNYILNAIGNDLVLKGLSVKQVLIDQNIVTIIINPGLLIQDTTLIRLEEESELSLNINPYSDTNGYLIVYTDYVYLESSQQNNLTLKLSYITTDGENIYPTSIFDPNRNRILLHRFTFTKLPQLSVTQILDPIFTIFNKDYYLLGETNFTNFSIKLLDHAINSSQYGYATDTKAGHIRVGSNLNITDGTLSVKDATTLEAGVLRKATELEALLLESDDTALTPKSLRNMILNLKNIEIQVVDPGITLGTAMILGGS